MPWTWEEINSVWYRVPLATELPAAEEWVALFNVVDRYFGREWLDEQRVHGGAESWGPGAVASVLSQGKRLQCLDGVAGTATLIEKLRRQEPAAWAELTAIWIVTSDDAAVELEVEPPLPGSRRIPDFRVRHGDGSWTYVEVTQPQSSKEQKHADKVLADLTGLLNTVHKQYALEVFLRRMPSRREIEHIRARVPLLVRSDGADVEELPDGLGTLFLNDTEPGMITTNDHGEESRPRLGRANVHWEDGKTQRHIVVRLAFSDDRADAFLKKEAAQLVKSAPGLIMIDTTGAPGGFTSWESLLRARLQPSLYTRVSGICLFRSGMFSTNTGVAWEAETRIVANPHTQLRLPEWITSNIGRNRPVDCT